MTKIISILRPLSACALMLFLTACVSASGPTFSQAQASVAPVAADQGRIFFYRDSSSYGWAVFYFIDIDDAPVDGLWSSGCFFVDKPPGAYKITTRATQEWVVGGDVTVTLAAGETKYIRTDRSGFWVTRVLPIIIDPQQASKEIADCHLHSPMQWSH